jgi:hypothetical protein
MAQTRTKKPRGLRPGYGCAFCPWTAAGNERNLLWRSRKGKSKARVIVATCFSETCKTKAEELCARIDDPRDPLGILIYRAERDVNGPIHTTDRGPGYPRLAIAHVERTGELPKEA